MPQDNSGVEGIQCSARQDKPDVLKSVCEPMMFCGQTLFLLNEFLDVKKSSPRGHGEHREGKHSALPSLRCQFVQLVTTTAQRKKRCTRRVVVVSLQRVSGASRKVGQVRLELAARHAHLFLFVVSSCSSWWIFGKDGHCGGRRVSRLPSSALSATSAMTLCLLNLCLL